MRSADRIYVLHEGEIVESGNHQELMALRGRYAELFTLQAAAYLDEAPEHHVSSGVSLRRDKAGSRAGAQGAGGNRRWSAPE